MTIYPTHHCFDDAMEYLDRRVRADPDLVLDTRLQLVHGIITGQDATGAVQRIAHAWVEERTWSQGTVVHHAGLLPTGVKVLVTGPRDEYYERAKVEQPTRYTLVQVWQLNSATGHTGPWRPEYEALCRQTARR